MKIPVNICGEVYTVPAANALKPLGFEFAPYDDYRMRILNHDGGSIDINTLDDVLALADEYGKIIIYGDDYSGRKITIYNDCLELE